MSFDDFRVVRDNLSAATARRETGSSLLHVHRSGTRARRLNETEAKKRGIAYRLAKMPMAGVLRAVTLGETRGFFKVLVNVESDAFLDSPRLAQKEVK